ncbi:MAG: hypothetical protein OWQ51_12420 [Pyrobaculum arsenaticum]|uniref:Transmembrane protein n=2 Tax=Pyrobaculum arsenaticum TaxID=121277 RepID=A4WHV6_PYRAR|nr:hypothetical protein [Pyrobaculum arsenaticum]ABP49973.1 hypothetical protein Pars_0368 [Pyrobaculum arsenaticum DSM 13514]MCY0891747.1 hypothetical protein [Pyrobaculum arsenaticum]NYR15059.1 hypothetical protein [Pyrobaculum arsenaticum]
MSELGGGGVVLGLAPEAVVFFVRGLLRSPWRGSACCGVWVSAVVGTSFCCLGVGAAVCVDGGVVSSALLGVVWKVLGVIGGDGVVGARRGLWVVGAGCGVWCRLLGRRWWRDSFRGIYAGRSALGGERFGSAVLDRLDF